MRGAQLLAAATDPWTTHDTRLIVVTVLAIAIIVVLIAWLKMHPFLALTLGCAFLGLASASMPIGTVITSYEKGVGAVLMEVGLLIGLGSMLGKLLADSGGADRIVDTLLAKAGGGLVPWAMALVAMIIGLPMFFEIGLVLLLPVIIAVAHRSGLRLMRVAIPALAGLSALHGLVPPHPGPLIAINAVGAELGTTLAFGIVIAIPTVIICGPLFSLVAAKWVPVMAPTPEDAGAIADEHGGGSRDKDVVRQPSFGITVFTILFPVLLMLGKAISDLIWPAPKKLDGWNPPMAREIFDFIGEPLVAMLLAVLLAMVTFGYAVGFNGKSIADRFGKSLAPIAGVMLIVGAGGGFKQLLIDAGVGATVAKWATGANVSVLLLGWLVAVAIRLATGSATVATTTAAGIVAPLAVGLTPAHAALLALAIGAGSLFLSHVNDAGFWLVSQMFRMNVGQTFKTWSVMETLISIVGLAFVMLASAIF